MERPRCDGAATLLFLWAALTAPGCQGQVESKAELNRLSALIVPAQDVSVDCHDLAGADGSLRACWSPACRGGVCRILRTQPGFAPPTELGWRCTGVGNHRTCADRARGVGRFQCKGDRCVQYHPRVPDANEWSCSDASGAQLCLFEGEAAGVTAGRTDAGFVCGQRLANSAATRQKLCIDYSPDFPDANPSHWSCHYEGAPSLTRICQRKSMRALGASCRSTRTCVPGTLCVSGNCVPYASRPNCWLDADCKSQRCRMGRCLASSAPN